jgi:hypothetical protein
MLKHLTITTLCLLLATTADATTKTSPPKGSAVSGMKSSKSLGVRQGQSQTTQSNSQSTAEANNEGNNQSITFNQSAPAETTANVNYSGTQSIKNAPSMGSPALTSSNDTCMGSVSAAASGMGFGLAGGKTYTDENCKMLKNARELWNMGMRAAALALMCMDSKNRDALELTGFTCPQTEKTGKNQMAQTPDTATRTASREAYSDIGKTGN